MASWMAWWQRTTGAIAEIVEQVQTQTQASMEQWFSQSAQSMEKELDRVGEQFEADLDQWWEEKVSPLEESVTRTLEEWEPVLQPWMAPLLDWHLDPQVQQAWAEMDRAVDEAVIGGLERLGVEQEERLGGDWEDPNEALWNEIAPRRSPSADWHPACRGCQDFHGRSYGGNEGRNVLVCAMHPYGVEGDRCVDWREEKPDAS